ncbi:MAG: Wzz/FepE/Etk N-terminal domain-containing protein [Clostridia bacterium]|nr:Wzz/FepE/Etk N-terminal domain-containing protein [Clostridia bacterium]
MTTDVKQEVDTGKTGIFEFNLANIMQALLEKIWLIVCLAVLCAAVGFSVSSNGTTKYQANIKIYVENTTLEIGGISMSNQSASRGLVSTYVVILNTRDTLRMIAAEAGAPEIGPGTLQGMISATSINGTAIMFISVTDTSERRALALAEAIGEVLKGRIESVLAIGAGATVIETAEIYNVIKPSATQNMLIGFVIGALLGAALIVLQVVTDPYIKDEKYMTEKYKLPVLACIPDITDSRSRKYYYHKKGGYGSSYSSYYSAYYSSSHHYGAKSGKLSGDTADQKTPGEDGKDDKKD